MKFHRKDIDISAILVGVAAAIISNIVLGLLLLTVLLIRGGDWWNDYLTSSLSINLTMLFTLITTAFGGYYCMKTEKSTYLNPAIVGLIVLLVSLLALADIGFHYASEHRVLQITTGLLTIPSGIVGAWFYMRNKQNQGQ